MISVSVADLVAYPIGWHIGNAPKICILTPEKETENLCARRGFAVHRNVVCVIYLPVVGESLRHMQIHRHPPSCAQVRVVVRMRVWMWMRVWVVMMMRVDGVVHWVVLDMRCCSSGCETGVGSHRVVPQNGSPWWGHESTAVVLHNVAPPLNLSQSVCDVGSIDF